MVDTGYLSMTLSRGFAYSVALLLLGGCLLELAAQEPIAGRPTAPRDTAILRGMMEVTQGLQTPTNTVPLVAGRPTWVRGYIQLNIPGTTRLRGRLRVQTSTGVDTTLISPATAELQTGATGLAETDRDRFEATLNFLLDPALTPRGETTLQLLQLFHAETGQLIACPGCEQTLQRVAVGDSVELRVKVIGLRVGQSEPRVVDQEGLRSWLFRALPVSATQVAWRSVAIPTFLDCGRVNARLLRIRALDMRSGQDPRTHYYGMVYDGGGTPMRGCSSGTPVIADPSTVASGPAGEPKANLYFWDKDGTYADWYGTHEIAHTLGLEHPADPICQPIAAPSEGVMGMDQSGGRILLLRGEETTDLMGYTQNEACAFPWLSTTTYKAILDRLRDEEIDFSRGATGSHAATLDEPEHQLTLAPAPFLHVFGYLKRSVGQLRGGIDVTTEVAYRGRAEDREAVALSAVPLDHQVTIQPLNRIGEPIGLPVAGWLDFRDVNRTPESAGDWLGRFNIYVPNDSMIAMLRLSYRGQPVQMHRVSVAPPQLKRGSARITAQPPGLKIDWDVRDPDTPAGNLIFFIQESTDGGRRWTTVQEQRASYLPVKRESVEGRETLHLRVIATDQRNDRVLFTTCNLVLALNGSPPEADPVIGCL